MVARPHTVQQTLSVNIITKSTRIVTTGHVVVNVSVSLLSLFLVTAHRRSSTCLFSDLHFFCWLIKRRQRRALERPAEETATTAQDNQHY